MLSLLLTLLVGVTLASDEACPMNGFFGYGPKVCYDTGIIIVCFTFCLM